MQGAGLGAVPIRAAVPLHRVLLGAGRDPCSPCRQASLSGPAPAFAALLWLVGSEHANSARAERLRIRSFSAWSCSFEGICFTFKSHRADRASNAVGSVFS